MLLASEKQRQLANNPLFFHKIHVSQKLSIKFSEISDDLPLLHNGSFFFKFHVGGGGKRKKSERHYDRSIDS